ncbi:MAG: hypothetical protein K6T51_01185 [Rubrobacteraceae bacterium]|nr:hypothetical protein [Rubrobacteraceae bacterium]
MEMNTTHTKEEIMDILENVDWTEVHRRFAFGEYGDYIDIFADGSIATRGSSEYYRDPDAIGLIGSIRVLGAGNIDRSQHYEGAYEHDMDSGLWRDLYTGEMVGEETMLRSAIENGEWSDLYEDWQEQILLQQELL